jgi:3-deoxy-D-manno-octulosonic-acid transferase
MSLYGVTYNTIGTLLAGITLPVWLPYVIARHKYRTSFLARAGVLPPGAREKLNEKPTIWLHAVSVGEFLLAHTLLEELRPWYPRHRFVVTVTTLTGHEVARSKLSADDILLFFPVEFYPVMNRIVSCVRPELALIVETEIWPNFIYCLDKLQIPVVLVNGRLSEKSYRRYMRVKPFIRDVLRRFTRFLMQAEEGKQRIMTLGAPGEKVAVSGNIKFDSVTVVENPRPDRALVAELNLPAGVPLLIMAALEKAGREDSVALDVIERIRTREPGMGLIIVPRHPERGDDIARLVASRGYVPRRRSLKEFFDDPARQVFIVDTVGELQRFYSLACVVYVGKSLFAPGGGQNMIEPVALGKPTLYGPYTKNFRGTADVLAEHAGAQIVHTPEELADAAVLLYAAPAEARQLVLNGQAFIRSQQGATRRTIETIHELLPPGDPEIRDGE